MRSVGLYIHIPFCARKCNYCDFYSLACAKKDNLSDYVSIICSQIEKEAHLYRDCIFDTIFLGGGTPSLLSGEDIIRLFDAIRANLAVSDDAEISIEANPGTIDEAKLNAYRVCGINRISIGLQSSHDSDLCTLGRIHTLGEFEKSYALVKGAGFENINIDIMYALPSQSIEALVQTVDYVAHLNPTHISAYCLKIEDGTPFSKMKLDLPSEDAQFDMYMALCKRLSALGYEQYEISNFAKNGARCVHNLKYWLSKEYVGFGPSAHSFFDGVRYFYDDSLDSYMSAIKDGGLPEKLIEEMPALSDEEKMDEYVMLALRLCDGISKKDFKAHFGIEFESAYSIQEYIDSGHIAFEGESYRFTSKGFFVSNYILSNMLKTL